MYNTGCRKKGYIGYEYKDGKNILKIKKYF